MGKNLIIALLASLALHLGAMSVVTIVAPSDFRNPRKFTKVDFLGPIFKKTAFDMMIEGVTPRQQTSYGNAMYDINDNFLESPLDREQVIMPTLSNYIVEITDSKVISALGSSRVIPGFLLSYKADIIIEDLIQKRKVVYKPAIPNYLKDNLSGEVIVIVTVTPLGRVKQVEPVTTSGNSGLDLELLNYVKSWVFESIENEAQDDQILEIDVTWMPEG